MTPYIRPAIDSPVYRDADGQVVGDGNRWGRQPTPEYAYSVVTHPERFAPLHEVADALIAYVSQSYDVELDDDASVAADLMIEAPAVVRAVRVTPGDPVCASLTFVFTSFPGVLLHAGVLHDFAYPTCGCDACDENWETQADEMEKQVFAVVTGNYREKMGGGTEAWVEHSLEHSEGSESGRISVQGSPRSGCAWRGPRWIGALAPASLSR